MIVKSVPENKNAQNYLPCLIKLPQVTNSVTKLSFFWHEGISSKIFGVFVNFISKNLSHFHPYNILTGDGWIRGLQYVK